MSRIFRRGELKEAIVLVLDGLGEAHGYAIMAELKDRVGGGWKPSPGAIYPALLALVETGHVRTVDRDGTRMYSLTEQGRRVAATKRSSSRWASLAARAEEGEERVSVGSLLDGFAEASDLRRRLARTAQRERIEAILARANAEIARTLDEGAEEEEGERDG
jgi:DNA-binding PadR family transcriptional regulator